jgi:DNA polymerase III subunit chi
VVRDPSPSAQLAVACRIVEKAWRAGSTVLIQHSDPGALDTLDALLWTAASEQGFIPHEIAEGPPALAGTPVILNTGTGPSAAVDVLINLTAGVPTHAELAGRIIEIIDTDPQRRAAGRQRFKAYRERGFALESHEL